MEWRTVDTDRDAGGVMIEIFEISGIVAPKWALEIVEVRDWYHASDLKTVIGIWPTELLEGEDGRAILAEIDGTYREWEVEGWLVDFGKGEFKVRGVGVREPL